MTTVIKIGGGLAARPGALDAVCAEVSAAGQERPLVVVPGGGPFADAVRSFDRSTGLSAASAHWMAILAMDQYAYVLAERMPGSVLVEDAGTATEALVRPGVAVLAPSRWMRAADVFPRSWGVTSDSVAAFVAGALDADHLIVVKPVAGGRELLDAYFDRACPAGLRVTIVGCEPRGDLAAALRS